MELGRFLVAVRRHLLIPVTLLAIGTFGSFLYEYATPQYQAASTVAVLDPLTAHPLYGSAQVTLDEVVKSERLHERVANRIGKSPGYVANRLSVALVPALSPLDPSPLYSIRGKAETQKAAVKLTNVAVDEAVALYEEMNAPDPQAIKSAVGSSEVDAQKEVDDARAAIQKFEDANSAPDYPLLLARESAVVATLEGGEDSYQVNSSVLSYAAQYSQDAYNQEQLLLKAHGTFDQILSKHEAELTRLQGLENQYAQLTFNLESAQTRLTSLKVAEQGQILGQLYPQQSQVKVLDSATPTSTLTTTILIYAVGAVTGLAIGLGTVYGVALIEKEPASAESLSDILRAPILVRIPGSRVPVAAGRLTPGGNGGGKGKANGNGNGNGNGSGNGHAPGK